MADADATLERSKNNDQHIAALTTMDRTEWAKTREEHFSSGINKASLDQVYNSYSSYYYITVYSCSNGCRSKLQCS